MSSIFSFFFLLIITTFIAASQNYVLEKVCYSNLYNLYIFG
ncbi:unnamed protein product [Brugia timori]|uniref:Uncharacterized protein n=1 Tax=Brugia timori TaxID=42155 RepID=A0A0R3QMB9_9BILA|nr:unnamed protein product [Brugia timori]